MLKKSSFIRIPEVEYFNFGNKDKENKKEDLLKIYCDNDYNSGIWFNRKCKIGFIYVHIKFSDNLLNKNHTHVLCDKCYNKLKD